METKVKKGKAIIGIAMAAIMGAVILAAMVSSTVATRDAGGEINIGDVVYRGEHYLNVTSPLGDDSGTFYGIADSTADGQILTVANASDFSVPKTAKVGPYNKTSREGKTADIIVQEPEITASIFLEGTTNSIVGKSIPVGQNITIRAEPNFGGIMNASKPGFTPNFSKIAIKLMDPDGLETVKKIDATAQEIDVTPTVWPRLDTTDWDTGEWTVKITSDKDTCNEVDVSSPEYKFTIRSEELSITAEKDEVGKGDNIILTVNGDPSRYYYFAIENVKNYEEPEIQDTYDITARGTGEGITGNYTAAWIKTGSDGIADIKISTAGADDRTYTMNVYDTYHIVGAVPINISDFEVPPADVKNAVDDDDVKVKVREATVTFDIPTTAIIGEDVVIKGTVSAGKKVDILIEDGKLEGDRWDNEPVHENDEFEVKWATDKKMTGTYSIDVYIDCDYDAETGAGKDLILANIDEDGRTTIRLVEPGLTAEQLRNVVAEGDDYTIEGTATGVDTVDIVLIGPKGFMADAYSVIDGLLITSTSVTDNEFSEDIRMVDGLDTGQWMAAVFSPGRDGYYGSENITAGNLADADLSLEGKTRDQLIAILTDYTMEQAGSDDALVVFTFKVESGYIDLNPVETVAIGEPLNLTGVTNREPETLITISTFAKPAGATDLPAVLAEVEWSTKDEGVFSGTIDTTDAVPGTYTLEADDGDGNTDTITVELVEEIVPVATPTAAPTAKPTVAPVPTAEPTATPEPTPTPTPGFEAVFAIAGLLSIAYLVLRRRK